MNRTVYFADKSVVFTAETSADSTEKQYVVAFDDACVPAAATAEELLPANVTKILQTHNCVRVAARDPEAAFAAFAAGFARVEAAGGIVRDGAGRWLLIYRNGRWDLPKGHIEAGESPEACAAREVAEETGVAAATGPLLCRTWHAYWFPPTARWELKRTHWYALEAAAPAGGTAPQHEEGIEAAVWCAEAEALDRMRSAFPTVQRVAEAMLQAKAERKV